MNLYGQLFESYKKDDLRHRDFIPLSDLGNLITRPNVKAELRKTQKNRLLVLFRFEKSGALASRVTKDGQKLFAILLHLNLPWGVKKLLDNGFTDSDLPFSREDKYLVSATQSTKRFKWPEDWGQQSLNTFLREQWLMLAPVFTNGGNCGNISVNQPLPFLTAEPEQHTASNVIFKAEIHASHQKGFESLQKTKHITQKLDTFRVDNVDYIIFPWAEGGDLDNFWKIRDSKGEARSPELALWCLEQMLGLAEALQALHLEMEDQSNCRHGDLKPGNILHFPARIEGSHGILKMADFGISRIHNLGTMQRQGVDTTTRATTPSYQAPEGDSDETRSRKFDIWSLGCIFLEFALWVLRDCTALENFDAARRPKTPGLQNRSHFYVLAEDGAEIHPAVVKVILDLRSLNPGGPDTAFGELLHMIESQLIQVQVEKRIDAGMTIYSVMAEAFAALGIAANIFQFLELGFKATQTIITTYRDIDLDGLAQHNAEIALTCSDFEKHCSKLKNDKAVVKDADLAPLLTRFINTATKLSTEIGRLRVPDSKRHRKRTKKPSKPIWAPSENRYVSGFKG
ncbi:Serine/threonine-protein kinase nekl-2 [Colletotrichum sp. SAR11_240]|nr:Serine/threonine-protein kinase nekl-2 [Colletotrichum sp. SAR11_240]